jgi:hypothetical protein
MGLLSRDAVSYYPEVLLGHYVPSPALGVLVFGLAAATAVLLIRARPEQRPLPLALIVGLAATMAHPYKLPRFLLTVTPLIWLCAGLSVAVVLSSLPARSEDRHRRRLARAVALLVLAIPVAVISVDRDQLVRDHRVRTVSPTVIPLLDTIARSAEDVSASVLLGHWNELSPGLVEWHCYQVRPTIRRAQVPQWLPSHRRHGDVVSRLADDRSISRLFVIDIGSEPNPISSAFERENRWLESVRAAVASDPRFRLSEERTFPVSGYLLQVFDRRR